MSYRKNGFGLLIVIIGMMAFASSAHATLGFRINLGAALHASIGAEQIGTSILLVAATNMELHCAKFTVQEGLIINGAHAKGKLLYEECKPFVHSTKEENKPCHVVVSAADTKLHVTATGLILPAELLTKDAKGNLLPAILVENIAALILFLGAECTLPEDNKVTGELCLAIEENDAVKPLIRASAHIQSLCKPRNVLEGGEVLSGGVKDELKYGKSPAQVIAEARVFLTGTHANQKLSVELF